MPLTYKDAGVDIDAGNELVRRIAPLARATRHPLVLGDLGGFSGLCGIPAGLREPVLVATTDGVGTKLKLAFRMDRHDTIGIDLVAMSVNDLACVGARPLLFLDYFATAKLDVGRAEKVIAGIAAACRTCGCALLGGETAEMPGLYAAGEYDLAGFAVGVADRADLLDGRDTAEGDVVVGLASTGFHSNGYSLVLRTVEAAGWDLRESLPGLDRPLGEMLLEPTRLYPPVVAAIRERAKVKAIAHITGGGWVENPPRVIPEGLGIRFRAGSWAEPPLFDRIRRAGEVAEPEMRRTFNLGVGLMVVASPGEVDGVIAAAEGAGVAGWRIGEVVRAGGSERVSFIER